SRRQPINGVNAFVRSRCEQIFSIVRPDRPVVVERVVGKADGGACGAARREQLTEAAGARSKEDDRGSIAGPCGWRQVHFEFLRPLHWILAGTVAYPELAASGPVTDERHLRPIRRIDSAALEKRRREKALRLRILFLLCGCRGKRKANNVEVCA